MRAYRWRRLAVIIVAVALLVPAVVTARPEPVAARGIQDLIEGAVPPGARQLLAGIRVIKGIGARNEVYEEAHQVQRQLWAYYDARIEKAQQQMIKRQQLGLRDSQYQAYKRVKASLEAEREMVNQITEAEKKEAKDRFEGRLRRELLGAIARSPKGQEALRDIREALSDVRDRFGQVQAALEGGNPINVAVDDLQRQVNRLRSAGTVLSLLSGRAGAELQRKANAVQGLINQVTGATSEAAAAGKEAFNTLDSAIGTLDQQIENPRRVRAAADLLTEEAANVVINKIFAPGGETPAEDVIADAIARGIDRNLITNVGVALGEIDPEELATMRERVRAQLLKTRLERIAAQCGRLTGALRQAALEALKDGSAPPESTPCSLFQNPDKLEEFIRSFTGQTATATTTVTTTAPVATATTPTTTSTLAGTDPLPWTFTGDGTNTQSLTGGTGSCRGDLTIEVALLDDGTVTGSMDLQNPSVAFTGFDMECDEPVPTTIPIFGNHDAGAVTILIGSSESLTRLEGSFTADTMGAIGQLVIPGQGLLEGKNHIHDWSMALKRSG